MCEFPVSGARSGRRSQRAVGVSPAVGTGNEWRQLLEHSLIDSVEAGIREGTATGPAALVKSSSTSISSFQLFERVLPTYYLLPIIFDQT
jgi:hypothetical protein